jgi:serine/threonine protein kinase
LHRTVAVKRLQERLADDPDSRRRFLLEAEVTAKLEHPGIVPVYGLFQEDSGRPAYAMRFVQGPTLWHAIDNYHAGPLTGSPSAGCCKPSCRSARRSPTPIAGESSTAI